MENLSLADVASHLLYSFKNEQELIQSIQDVGRIFNHMRENLNVYGKDKKLISAYVAYYMTTNYPKLKSALELINKDLSSYKRIIDIGTGPGTFLLAASRLNPDIELYGIDSSKLMLAQAKKILDGHHVEAAYLDEKLPLLDLTSEDLVIFGHSLNEMKREIFRNYMSRLGDADIFFIEPGTKESFSKIIDARAYLLDEGWHCHYPCASDKSCKLNKDTDWCHQFLLINHHPEVERLTQMLHRNRRLLPITLHFYSKKKRRKLISDGKTVSDKDGLQKSNLIKSAEHIARIIRVKRPTKFSFEWVVCDQDHSILNLEIPFKGLSKAKQKELFKVMSGKMIRFSVIKMLDEKLRVRLIFEDGKLWQLI